MSSLDHKRIERFQDEYLCLHCGKSWSIGDTEPPSCTEEPASSMRMLIAHTGKGMVQTVAEVARSFAHVEYQSVNGNYAWLVSDTSAPGSPAAVVYAETKNDATKYIEAVIGTALLLEVRHLKAMDNFAYGRAPYFELNPVKLKVASNAARCEVISLIKFREQLS